MVTKIIEFISVFSESERLFCESPLSFSLLKGENLVLFGTENSGLSEISNMILRIKKDYTGTIAFKNINLAEMDFETEQLFKREVGYVHGEYGLISNMSVEENISLPLSYHTGLSETEVKEKAGRLIDDLNLDHCKKLRPFDLSRSEILRTSYAMSIILDPDLLLIEYAFESHCPINVASLLDNLYERMSLDNKSVIIITYYPAQFINYCDKYMMMFNRRLVFSGNRDDFLEADNPYLAQYKNYSTSGPMIIL